MRNLDIDFLPLSVDVSLCTGSISATLSAGLIAAGAAGKAGELNTKPASTLAMRAGCTGRADLCSGAIGLDTGWS